MCVWRYKHTPSLTELDILQELKAHSEAVLDGFENNPWNFSLHYIREKKDCYLLCEPKDILQISELPVIWY